MRDVNSFRERFKHWKETGELPYELGVPKSLPGYDDGKDGVNFYKSYNDSGGSQWYVEPDGSITTIDGRTGGSIYTDNVYVTPKGNYTIPAGYTENEYNANLKNAAALSQPNSEMVSWTDASGKTRQDPRVIGMSAADPIGSLAVETATTATPMGALGRLGMYGLGRWGTTLTGFPALLNWARGKLISGAMNRSLSHSIVSPMLRPTTRTRVGDVEIDNPSLYYRQGSKEIVDDYLSTGTVRGVDSRNIWGDGYANNPIFQKGSLFWGNSKPALLVSNGKMSYADVMSRPISEEASLKGGLNWGIPAEPLNPSNTSAYIYEPRYGFRKVISKPSTIGWQQANASQLRTPGVFNSVNVSKYPDFYDDIKAASVGYSNKEMISKLANLFLVGDDAPVLTLDNMSIFPSSWLKRLYTQYPSVVNDELKNSILPRMLAQRNYVPGFDTAAFKQKFWDAANGEWISGGTEVFNAIDEENPLFRTGGFFDPVTEKIAVRAGVDTRNVLGHEIRHRIDHFIPLTSHEERLLNEAYGKVFKDLSYTHPAFNGLDMSAERVTLNRDAREELFNMLFPLMRNAPVRDQNTLISNARSIDIINAVKNGNGYGKAYIELLAGSPDWDIEAAANAIKKAMIAVGGVAAPIGLAIPTLSNNQTSLPENKHGKDALPGFGVGKIGTLGNPQWLKLAEQAVKLHEQWRDLPYADAPKGKNWRSVGWGFNDSGFFDIFPEGISKRFEKGMPRAFGDHLLRRVLKLKESLLRSLYGSYWDKFTDLQKAAILDTDWQRPVAVRKGSEFYNAIMKNDPNAVQYLGVKGYDSRNNDRRTMFGTAYGDAIRNMNLPTAPILAIPTFQDTVSQSPKVIQPEIVVPEQPKPINYGYWGSLAFNKGFRQQLGSDMMSLINE